ncbi:neuraminidase-like domain-containing protein (plasmid) [Enterobacter sp. JS8-1]|uniref:Tc toxin subunit A-related protein n=1 Tax=Enterobacter sp. JS8-1 TaxID=3411633 RepID=UPI003BA0E77E
MYETASLLKKAAKGCKDTPLSLGTLQPLSFAEIRKKFENVLSWSEAQHLYREAQEQLKKNKILESRIFTRANPQLPQAIRSGIRDNATSRSYDSMFGSRSSSFVKPGSVASMFSPAGYLTELYREAKGLHSASSVYNLDVRRPDLAGLLLSQENMDEEISTLTLSNEILLSHVEKKTAISGDELLEHFSTDRFSGATPYHQPYETLRQSILALDPELDALASAPDVMSQADPSSLLAIMANISPELHDILKEDLSGDPDLLFAKNFPDSVTSEQFTEVDFIADYYDLTESEVQRFVGLAGYISDEMLHGSQQSFYKNNVLSSIYIGSDGVLNSYQMSRNMSYPTQTCFTFTELFCRNGGGFIARCCSKKDLKKVVVRIGQNGPALATMEGVFPAGTVITSTEFNLTAANQAELETELRLVFTVEFADGTSDWFSTWMIRREYPQTEFTLRLNKAIRLCRATGLLPEELERIVFTTGTDGLITDSVLEQIFLTLLFRDRYRISIPDALAISGAKLAIFSSDEGVSHFDQIFNTPALAGEWFSADNSNISLAPDAVDASFARDSLLRGLTVTRGELYQLGLMSGLITATSTTLKLTLANVSALYRLSLAARLSGLTINELYLLFTVSPFTVATSTAFVQYLYQLSRWMGDAGLSAAEVWMLTSADHPQALTPEMLTLRSTIASAVSVQDVSAAADDATRRRLIAPYIAGTLGLSSPDLAASLVLWCENAGCFTLESFLTLLLKETLSADEEGTLAGYLHVLAQYSLTTQALSLSEAEVSVLASVPGARQLLPDVAQDNALARLMSLHYFHQWLNTLGRESSTILAALNEGRLTTTLIASAMALDEAVLAQALSCVDEDASAESTLGNWQTIYQILQWVNVATALNTMPAVVKQLVDIRLSGMADEQPSWEEWKNLSRSLEAALTQRQAATLTASTAERLSDVLCSWFLANVENDGVTLRSHDDLYSYFLIDNQVSSEVTTTRLAEAIAGIQLYINRALNRIEPHTVNDVSTRQFFIDWEMNSRYSTWGGMSRLAYYPENYVDPLQRIGQTKMMDELLQNINQSQLSEDTVEDAFKTYLARFETVADLKVISAYHDNVNNDSGKTWFIGRGREAVGEYYWRNVDMSRFSEGKLPANAWSEWVKIDTPINAWRDTVRPVIFRDRLYVVWVEQEEVATNGTSNPVISYRHTLKLAFLRHDNNWSSPWNYDISEQIDGVLGKTVIEQNDNLLGLTASGYKGEDTILIYLYKVNESYSFPEDESKENNIRGMMIYSDGNFSNLTKSKMRQWAVIANTFDSFDEISEGVFELTKRASYCFAVDYEAPSWFPMGEAKGDFDYSVMTNASIPKITIKSSSEDIKVVFHSPAFDIRHESNQWLVQRQLYAMKLTQGTGSDEYAIHGQILDFEGKDINTTDASQRSVAPITAYNIDRKTLAWTAEYTQFINGGHYLSLTSINNNRVFFEPYLNVNHGGDGVKTYTDDRKDDYISCAAAADRFESNSGGWLWSNQILKSPFILTAKTPAENVCVSIDFGNEPIICKASEHVTQLPEANFNLMNYTFKDIEFNIPHDAFEKNLVYIDVTFIATALYQRSLGMLSGTIAIRRVDYSVESIIQLHETDAGVQYMQIGAHRIRLNTLLASQLVSRANIGINAILSMGTQRLPEYQLGKGFWFQLTLPKYDPNVHGNESWFKISYAFYHTSGDRHPIMSGYLSSTEETVILLFYTYPDGGWQQKEKCHLEVAYSKNANTATSERSVIFEFNSETGAAKVIRPGINPLPEGIVSSVSIVNSSTSSLDFNSSCALYYWELFYYVPMMCFRRLLQESKFEAARNWMNYVWNPNGYIVNGEIAPWVWNCRPLEETTSWNANPLDAIDPDAVAQNDPTHYKVATFMDFIEMLVTRGDMCYRELTRDALAEAKMWYVHALGLMGDEPQDYGTATWNTPSLADAASTTTRDACQDLLATIEPAITFPDVQDEDDTGTDDSTSADVVMVTEAEVMDEEDAQTRTANSLTDLFLPEYNPALTEMWATLRLRLYNLRHNLSIDGQPLSLSIYAEPADPAALLSSMVQASAGGAALPAGRLSLFRFPVMLERARNLVSQLTQFGSGLLSMAEHDDADAFSTLLMQQGMELITHSIRLQQRSVDETEADIATMKVTLAGAQARLDKYTKLYDENVSAGERQAMILADQVSSLALASQTIGIIGGAADLAPSIFGFACGGSRWGALSTAMAAGMGMESTSIQTAADKVSRSEMYRRRREEWEIQRNNAQSEVDQIEAQLAGMAIRLEAAKLQVDYLETQQGHTLAQLEFMQRKFTNQALYSWMRGKLSAIYYQFFDIAQSCCLMAQEALRRELNDNSVTFVRGSAWNGSTAGFMAGETLLLNLAEMDKAWMEREERALEVTRTVSLAQVYAGLTSGSFSLTDAIADKIQASSSKTRGADGNEVKQDGDKELTASVKLSGLNIKDDYKSSLGATRRIKQVSVTLPALVGPYEDVRAVLSYGGSVVMPRGCSSIAVSHGMNDSGQFQLDFNDARYLPFEGIPVDDTGTLTLSFPDATGRQKALLESLSDIILHIRYTIQS